MPPHGNANERHGIFNGNGQYSANLQKYRWRRFLEVRLPENNGFPNGKGVGRIGLMMMIPSTHFTTVSLEDKKT